MHTKRQHELRASEDRDHSTLDAMTLVWCVCMRAAPLFVWMFVQEALNELLRLCCAECHDGGGEWSDAAGSAELNAMSRVALFLPLFLVCCSGDENEKKSS